MIMERHTKKTFKKEVNYNDSTLKEIAQKMRRYDHNSIRSALNSYKPNLSIVNSMIAVDSREAIAIEFLSTMAEDITFSGKKRCETVKSWIKKIVEKIPGSPRWEGIGKLSEKYIQEKISNLHNLSDEDYEIMNIYEWDNIGIIMNQMHLSGEKDELTRIFADFLANVGLDDYEEYVKFDNALLSYFAENAEGFRKAQNEATTLAKAKGTKSLGEALISRDQVEKMLGSSPRIKFEKIALTKQCLKEVILGNLNELFIPLFYERSDNDFKLVLPLKRVNSIARISFDLPKANKEIWGSSSGQKGIIFEDFLSDMLKGNWIGAVKDKTLRLFHKSHPPDFQVGRAIEYNYSIPEGRKNPRLNIKSSNPIFKEFLRIQEKGGYDIDIFLIHNSNPKHVLMGECKFTKEYKEKEYSDGIDHIKEFTEFVKGDEKAKTSLKIPLDYPIVHVLFTSFSGPIYRESDGTIKTTFPPIVSGEFKEWISNYISSEISIERSQM
jgi:hypothetical protein